MILLNGKRIDGTVGDALPIGTLSPFVGLVAPKGYLICMGQLVDKAKYPELYEICGNTFGTATATQFYLPDLRGVTIAGYKQGDSMFGTLGALIGGKTTSYTPAGANTGGSVGNHTLTAAESGMPTHKHNIVNSDVMIWCGTWGIQGNQGFTSGTQSIGSVGAKALGKYVTTDDITGVSASSAHNHGFTNPTFTGTEADINVVQPTAVMNWIIKASMLAVVTGNIEDSLTSTSGTDALSAKQGKTLKDLVDAKVNISDIVNNLTSTTNDKPLSAAQGKILNDKFDSYIIKGEVIYSNDSGSNGNITFTKTISNATYPLMKIFYRNNDNMLESKEIYNPVGYRVNLSTNDARSGGANNGNTYIKTSCYDISSTGMTMSTGTFNFGNCAVNSNGTITMDGVARILYITKVVVYKTV